MAFSLKAHFGAHFGAQNLFILCICWGHFTTYGPSPFWPTRVQNGDTLQGTHGYGLGVHKYPRRGRGAPGNAPKVIGRLIVRAPVLMLLWALIAMNVVIGNESWLMLIVTDPRQGDCDESQTWRL